MNSAIELVYPTEVLAGCISIYRNVWENIDEIIESVNFYSDNPETNFNFVSAGTIGNDNNGGRTNSHMCLNDAASDSKVMKQLSDDYYKLIFSTSVGFNRHFNINEPVFFNEPFNILKYQTGEEYASHYDGGSATGRTISPILYLNDDYEGGEIEFVNFGIKIKPEKGMLIIFPATYPYRHIAHPVTSGTKYAIVTWLHDRNWDLFSQIGVNR